MTARAPDAAELAIIHACRARLLEALDAAIYAEAEVLEDEGHAVSLVCEGMVAAASQLLGQLILDEVGPANAALAWAELQESIGDIFAANAAAQAGPGALVSTELQ